MWSFAINACAPLVIAMIALSALADEPVEREKVLVHQLNNLESHVIQRKGRTPRTSDLLIGQERRISERRLNTLKTRAPRSARIPLLGRQLERVRPQNKRPNR